MPPLPALGLPAAPVGRSRPSRRSSPPSAAATVPSSTAAAAAAAPFSGADFVRPHLRTLAAYTPILPFDVLSAQLGRAPADIIKLDANENPYGPPPGAWRGGEGGWCRAGLSPRHLGGFVSAPPGPLPLLRPTAAPLRRNAAASAARMQRQSSPQHGWEAP